ncbi:hypothetical protein EmuJ_001155300 [Echinococcus multilocularis]|uniref:Uncharacterized protein n=1 Tax=Echinococcus multilocularis TaxID=6211 RepID=A0A068YG29_ECHMU|nr:hypothetical protein EmuJ_001155300 [Echinococcus multilocularis]
MCPRFITIANATITHPSIISPATESNKLLWYDLLPKGDKYDKKLLRFCN